VPGLATMLQISLAPAPEEVVEAVEEIVVETALEAASVFRIRLGIAQNDAGDWRFLQDDLFRPLEPVQIRLTIAEVPEALVNGYVSRQEVDYADEAGSSTLEISGQDATILMNLEEKVKLWANMPDSAIAAAIFGEHRLVPMVQQTAAPTLSDPEGTTIQRGSDLRFVRGLAARNGFDFYVQPEPLTGLDQGFFRPRQTSDAVKAVLNVSMGVPETNVSGFRVRYDMAQPTGAAAAALDSGTKEAQTAQVFSSALAPMGSEPALTRLQQQPVVRPARTGLMRTSDLQAYAQGIADASSFAIAIEGQAGPDVGILRPGDVVAVRGVGRLYNGLYLVSRVTHRIDGDSYTQQFEAKRNAATMTGAEPYAELPF
jgi:phage protein D